MIPPDAYQSRPGVEDLSGRLFRPAVVFLQVGKVCSDVTAVHDFDIAVVEQWATQVPVVMGPTVGRVVRQLPDSIRGQALVVCHLVRSVRQTVRNAKNSDICIQVVKIQ